MSGLANSTYDSIEAAIAAFWTDITEVGENDDFESFPWSNFTPPFAAIIGSRALGQDDSPTSSVAFTMPLRLAYIGPISVAGQWRTLRDKLDSAIFWFQGNALTFGQIISIDGITWGRDIDTNLVMIEKNYTDRMAILDITVRFGYQGGFP